MSRDWHEGWKGQYRRMLRWNERLNSVSLNDDIDTIYDFIYAFFQSCYHLRDWLLSDGVVTKGELKELFESSIELKLCRDICNSSKHLQYDSSSIDPKPRIGREWDPFQKMWHGWYLYSDERRPVAELVNNCVTRWNSFLSNKHLI